MQGATFGLQENLKQLKLSTMRRELDTTIRQAREIGSDYADFLMELTAAELHVRSENRLKRRMREAKFPLIKTLESFDSEAAVDFDLRLLREMAAGDYIKKHRNIIFMGRSGTGNYVKFFLM